MQRLSKIPDVAGCRMLRMKPFEGERRTVPSRRLEIR
jgi:hypothetical protein